MGIGTRTENVLSRDRQIIRVSFVGIAANLLLAGFKVFVGLLSHSIAIILDAVNNLSVQSWRAGVRTKSILSDMGGSST